MSASPPPALPTDLVVTVLLFAGPREALGGAPSVALAFAPAPAPPPTVARLRAALAARAPAAASSSFGALLAACRFAVGLELVAPADEAARTVGAAGEEVALLAPVGGG